MKRIIRKLAVSNIQSYQGVTIVAGHYSFPNFEKSSFHSVFSSEDAKTYTAIFYIDRSAEEVW